MNPYRAFPRETDGKREAARSDRERLMSLANTLRGVGEAPTDKASPAAQAMD
jgi:hypothetical protein